MPRRPRRGGNDLKICAWPDSQNRRRLRFGRDASHVMLHVWPSANRSTSRQRMALAGPRFREGRRGKGATPPLHPPRAGRRPRQFEPLAARPHAATAAIRRGRRRDRRTRHDTGKEARPLARTAARHGREGEIHSGAGDGRRPRQDRRRGRGGRSQHRGIFAQLGLGQRGGACRETPAASSAWSWRGCWANSASLAATSTRSPRRSTAPALFQPRRNCRRCRPTSWRYGRR